MTDRRSDLAVALLIAAFTGGCVARPTPSQSIGTPLPTISASSIESPSAMSGLALADLGEDARHASFVDLLATDDGFLVLGGTGQIGEPPAAFSSADGVSWTEELISARSAIHPSELARWGDRVVALGGTHLSDCSVEGALGLWVRDRDGSWTEAPSDPALCVSGPVAVVIFKGRPWLVGETRSGVPILAESHDGFTWTDHHDQLGDVHVDDAAADASGLWIFGRTPDGSPITIHSEDGATWASEPLRTASGDEIRVDKVAIVRGAVVVLGATQSHGVRLVRVPGGSWGVAEMDGTFIPDFRSVSGGDGPLIGVDSGFVVEQRGVWVSGDGIAWRRVAMPLEFAGSVSAGAIHDDRVVFLAGDRIWTAPSSILGP
jgi:hypothetical protein